MQILQWLFRGSDPHHHTHRAAASPGGSRRILSDEEEAKVNELILFARGGACPSSHGEFADDVREAAAAAEEERNEKTIAILLTREDSKTWFFSTLHLKHFGNLYGSRRFRRNPSAEAPGGQVLENEMETAMVGCKVLPICHAAFAGSKRSDSGEASAAAAADGDAHKGERRKAISRVKELVRWAAAAKAYRGRGGWKVSYFRSKGNLKDSADERSSSSGKISLRWEVGSCSTASSVYSALSLSSSSARKDSWVKGLPIAAADQPIPDCDGTYSDRPRTAHWITTDSDFVVLEL